MCIALDVSEHFFPFAIRAGDKQQIEKIEKIEKIVKHAYSLNMTKLSVLYQEIPVGTSGWDVARKAVADAKGMTLLGVKSNLALAQVETTAKEVAAPRPARRIDHRRTPLQR